jgi:hypothetical protein
MPKNKPEEERFDPGINEHALDTEWLGQAKMRWRWSRKHADAKLAATEAKNRLNVVMAELTLAIRADPVTFMGPVKPTEDTVKAAVLVQKEYDVAHAEWAEAQHVADVLGAAVSAIDDRKRALENLVKLHGQDYFAEPRPDENTREAVAESGKRAARRYPQPDEDEEE